VKLQELAGAFNGARTRSAPGQLRATSISVRRRLAFSALTAHNDARARCMDSSEPNRHFYNTRLAHIDALRLALLVKRWCIGEPHDYTVHCEQA